MEFSIKKRERFTSEHTAEIGSILQMRNNGAALKNHCHVPILQKVHFVADGARSYDGVTRLVEFALETSYDIVHKVDIGRFEEWNLLIDSVSRYKANNK